MRSRVSPWLCLLIAAGTNAQTAADPGVADFDREIAAGQYETAAPQLEKYIAAHPQSWAALYQLGYVYFRMHRITKSVALLSRCLALNANHADAHRILGYDLNMLGRQDLAERELREAIRLEPASHESHYELGRILYERGRYAESVLELERVKALKPEFVKAYHNLGLAYEALHEEARAESNFKEGLERNAREAKPSSWPLIDFASYCNRREEFSKARDLLMEAARIDSRWDQLYAELAKSWRSLGNLDEAAGALRSAIERSPDKPDYHYSLAQIYRRTGDLKRARAELAAFETAQAKVRETQSALPRPEALTAPDR